MEYKYDTGVQLYKYFYMHTCTHARDKGHKTRNRTSWLNLASGERPHQETTEKVKLWSVKQLQAECAIQKSKSAKLETSTFQR